MRTSNERLDQAVGTPYRDRRLGEPGTEAARRRRRQTKPSKQHQKGLILHLKQKGTAKLPLWMQKQPQLPYSMTAPSNYRRKWRSSTPHRERRYCSNTSETNGGWTTDNSHHTLPHLTPGSPAALPIPRADRGEKRPLP